MSRDNRNTPRGLTQTVYTDGAGHYAATFTTDSVDHSATGNSIDANLANGHSAACGFFER
jgi:hypothetical protein